MNHAKARMSMRLLAASALIGASFSAPAQAAEELRIGFIAPKTGIFAQLGIDMQNGFQMYLDEHKGELGGAKVSLIVEDDQGKPDTGVTKANKLILSDKVHMLVGGVLATTGYALAPVATREKMLYIGSIATADDLGQRDFEKYPYMVRPTFVPSQPSHRDRRRIPEDVRGLRRQDRAENLAADRHQGFRAVHPIHQRRHRRDLRADGGADVAAIPQAVAPSRLQKADPRRRHQL
jgi:ABC-type sugar transport system substrate-binding protein